MFIGETDRAMHLMRNRGPRAGRFPGARFRSGDRKHSQFGVDRLRREVSRGRSGCGVSGEDCQVLLHSLKAPDRAAELHAILRVADRHRGDACECPRDLLAPCRRPERA